MNVFEDKGQTSYKKVSLVRVPLRLGEDVFVDQQISAKKAEDLERTMIAYNHLMHVHKVDSYRACATSAMREAKNGQELADGIFERTGIKIDIIPGYEEAQIIYSTHIEERIKDHQNFLYVDVGGGSTEISLFEGTVPKESRSFDIGTIRVLKNKVKEERWDDMKKWVKDVTQGHKDLVVIGSGGNINKIYKLHQKSNWESLYYNEIKSLIDELSDMNVDQRIMNFHLHPDRADVIVPAGKIFLKVMKWAAINEVQVPKMGLADGLIKGMHQGLTFSR
ncbi:exopolyphosphatase [bacterium SCSIO 12741]|nr:exopolyphosphatase [bacterium SCSIO 12741]